jgi:hypothetical protein
VRGTGIMGPSLEESCAVNHRKRKERRGWVHPRIGGHLSKKVRQRFVELQPYVEGMWAIVRRETSK